jgi:hypothetical protein
MAPHDICDPVRKRRSVAKALIRPPLVRAQKFAKETRRRCWTLT